MAQLRFVTLTGVDEQTKLHELVRLSGRYPFVEWGVLYSSERGGPTGRYPSHQWIEAFAYAADEHGLYVALHLCGAALRDLVAVFDESAHPAQAQNHPVLQLAALFGRVQLNLRADQHPQESLRRLIQYLHRSEQRTRVILQFNSANEAACQAFRYEHGVEVLVDSSGGRGISPDSWPVLSEDYKRVGYAGGLGPANIAQSVAEAAQAAGGRAFWVDMESKLRNAQDQFDLAACEQVLSAVEQWRQAEDEAAGALWGDELVPVQSLEGLWLDWWVGRALGYNMVVPPLNACRAVYLHRSSGEFVGFSPATDGHTPTALLHEERIALIPQVPPGSEDSDLMLWLGQAVSAAPDQAPFPAMMGDGLVQAGLRAVVAKYFGDAVPVNPTKLVG